MRQNLMVLVGCGWLFASSNARVQLRFPLSNSSTVSNTPLNSSALSTTTLSSSTLSTMPLDSSTLSTTQLNSTELSTTQLSSSALIATPLSSSTSNTTPLDSSTLSTTPLSSSTLSTTPLNSTTSSTTPLRSNTLSTTPLDSSTLSTTSLKSTTPSTTLLNSTTLSAAALNSSTLSATALNSSTPRTTPLGTGSPTANTKNGTLAWQTAGVAPLLPDTADLVCSNWNWTSEANDASPCYAVCADIDSVCLQVASAEATTCSSQWAAYESSSSSWASKYHPGYRTTSRTLYDSSVYSIFSSLSTDTDYTVTNGENGETFNPVYAFGTAPELSTSYTSYVIPWYIPNAIEEEWVTVTTTATIFFTTSTGPVTALAERTSGFPLPTPYCSVTEVVTISCGQCTIAGGYVQMYYWPVATSSVTTSASAGIIRQSNSSNVGQVATAVVDGITMTSPSVYISLQTLYATNQCGTVGSTHGGEILTMRPEDVSTVFGFQGAGYRPQNASQINYADLEGPVPASVYELNNACGRFGCATIYNDYYRPTLAIPPQVRSMDPAWAACGLDFEGLYDPPIALTPTNGVLAPTNPAGSSSMEQTTPAVPCSTPSHSQASPTAVPQSTALPQSTAKPQSTALPQSTSSQNQRPPPPASSGSVAPQPASSGADPSLSPPAPQPPSKPDASVPQSTTLGADPSPSAPQQQPPSNSDPSAPTSTSSAAENSPSPTQVNPAGGSNDPAPATSASNAAGVFSSILDPPTSAAQNPPHSQAPNPQTGGSVPATGPPAASSSQNIGGIIASIIGALPTSNNADPQSTAGSNDPTAAPAPNTQISVAPGVTLAPGSATTQAGTTFSVPPSGSVVVVNGATSTLPPARSNDPTTAPLPNSQFSVAPGVTLVPGSATTLSGTTFSIPTSGSVVVVNGATSTLPPAVAATAASLVTVGSQVFTPTSSGFVIGGQTLKPGSSITVSGTTISLASSGGVAVINGVTRTLAPTVSAAQPVLTVGTDNVTANSQGVFVIGGQTLTPGGSITVSGTTISLVSSGGVAVVNGVTETLAPTATAAQLVLTIGTESITANPQGVYTVDGQTLSPGSSITVSGTVISLAPSGSFAVVNGVTETLVLSAPAVLTVGSESITANSQGVYVIDGQTLTPGGIVTVGNGTTISLASSGGFAVINGVTETLASSAPAVLTVGSESVTANSLGEYMIDGQTLSPGGIIIIGSGSLRTTLSMLITSGETEVVFGGTSTEILHGSHISVAITPPAGGTAGATGTGTGAGANQATSTSDSSAIGCTVRWWSYLLVVLLLGFIWP